MELFLIINQLDSCLDCVYDPLTRDTKDILGMDDCVLIITHESLAKGFLKCHILDIS